MKYFLPVLLLAYHCAGYSQLTNRPARDTSWYVVLKDSTVLHTKKLWERSSDKEGNYLLLDNNKKVPLDDVARYKSRYGEYIRQFGPVETYRLENAGPRLFVYSRSFTYVDSTGFKEGNDYFLRKGSSGEMKTLDYKNLMDAVADNPACARELQVGRSTMRTAGVFAAAAFLGTIAGIAASFGKHTSDGKVSVSPLLVAGPVVMIGAVVVLFSGAKHYDKAIKLYNQ